MLFWDFLIDDAFNFFRYARNLDYHQQLVYNIDETQVEGCSNFLWILWKKNKRKSLKFLLSYLYY